MTARSERLQNSEDKEWVEKLPLSTYIADDADARAILNEVGVSI